MCAQLQLGNFSLQRVTLAAELFVFALQLLVDEFVQRFERFYLGLRLLRPGDFARLGAAPRVVVAGGSAGASAVYFHVDSVADALGSATTEVIGMPDAGFFLDLPSASDATNNCWPDQMRSIAALSNLTAHLNRACLARFADAPWKCMFPEYFADLISTRFFVINSLYDSSELW